MSELADLLELSDYATIVQREAFDLDPEVTAYLAADPERWCAALAATLTDIELQLMTRRNKERTEDELRWRSSAAAVKTRLVARMRYAKPLRSQARSESSKQNAFTDRRTLINAILDHRNTTLAADIDPEAHDLALWAVLDRLTVEP